MHYFNSIFSNPAYNSDANRAASGSGKSEEQKTFMGESTQGGSMELPWMTVAKMVQQAGRNTAGAMQQYGLNQRSDAMNARNQDIETGQAGIQGTTQVMQSIREKMAEEERQRRLIGGLAALAGRSV